MNKQRILIIEEDDEIDSLLSTILARKNCGIVRNFLANDSAALAQVAEMYSHKRLCVDDASRTATVNGDEVNLTNYEFEILKVLMAKPNKVFSREEIYETIWENENYNEDNTLNVHISNIRKKIAKIAPDEEYIKTVRGIGFKMA